MKLIVMIPCYNEEKTLPLVMENIPQQIPGIDEIETLVIDDGSSDETVKIAQRLGVDHIVRHVGNKGLAYAFATGIDAALNLDADIIVNTDGDNQYPSQDIPRLVKPVLDGEADIVIGDRQTKKIPHFTRFKKILQSFGSWVVRLASGTRVPDAPSGFRAYSREAALRLNIVTKFSYSVETVIQAGKRRITVTHIPVKTNPKTRESRLFKNIWQHVFESAKTIIRIYAMYEAIKIFTVIGGLLFLIGMGGALRFLYFYFFIPAEATGHLQSLVLSGVFLIVGFQIMLIGILADLIAINRKLMEEVLYRTKKIQIDSKDKNRETKIREKERAPNKIETKL